MHEVRIEICPAFPSDWDKASIRTPDIQYDYEKRDNEATFRIHTNTAVVKCVRANLRSPEITTAAETDSMVTAPLVQDKDAIAAFNPPSEPPVYTDPDASVMRTSHMGVRPPQEPAAPNPKRIVLLDLASVYNTTVEAMTETKFEYDYDAVSPVRGWWGNPAITIPARPRVMATPGGIRFLTAGRPCPALGRIPNDIIALTSWAPRPFPAEVTIPVGYRCARAWLLLQGYVHPMKNYITNGEIAIRYSSGPETVIALIPPYNLDAYFQHSSLEGTPIPLGQASGGGFVHEGFTLAHADALRIDCASDRQLDAIVVRGTCSEGIVGLLGVTLEKAD